MGKVEVEQLKYYKIVLDSTWSGIRELKENTGESIKKYGFAQSFKPVSKDGDIYKCIVPDEEKEYYLLCQQSLSEIRNIVYKHPEIPVSNPGRETIGDLLYMIDLYCDLYEEINLESSERFSCWDWCIDPRPAKGSLEEKVIIRRKTSLKMTYDTAKKILEKTGGELWDWEEYEFKKRNSTYWYKIIQECNETLDRYGMKLPEFMDKVDYDDDGNIYWKAKTKYHLLK